MSQSKFDDMIHDAHRAKRLAKVPAADLRDVARAIEMLAKVVEDLATILKEQERYQRS